MAWFRYEGEPISYVVANLWFGTDEVGDQSGSNWSSIYDLEDAGFFQGDHWKLVTTSEPFVHEGISGCSISCW